MDPLSVIFIPGGYAAALVLLSPLSVLAHRWWQRRGRARNADRGCGRCATTFTLTDELYWFSGLLVCAPCAAALRRRLTIGLKAVAALTGLFALTSGGALALSVAQGGPGLGWWLDGRWIPLLLPSVGLGLATATVVARGKRANRLAAAVSRTQLAPGRDPHAMTQLRIRARDA